MHCLCQSVTLSCGQRARTHTHLSSMCRGRAQTHAARPGWLQTRAHGSTRGDEAASSLARKRVILAATSDAPRLACLEQHGGAVQLAAGAVLGRVLGVLGPM